MASGRARRRRLRPGWGRRPWVAGVSLLFLACSPVRLVPLAPSAGNEARAQTATVEVRANADASQRLWAVPHAYIPVRLSVRNVGGAPIYVDLDDIQLTDGAAAMRAVPPASISPRHRVASLGIDPGSPFVAPQSGGNSVFGRTESLVLGPPVGWNAAAQGAHAPGREDILASAFNGGPIEGGQTRTGLVYFQHVPAGAERLTLRIEIRPAQSKGPPASVLEIVYAVQT